MRGKRERECEKEVTKLCKGPNGRKNRTGAKFCPNSHLYRIFCAAQNPEERRREQSGRESKIDADNEHEQSVQIG